MRGWVYLLCLSLSASLLANQSTCCRGEINVTAEALAFEPCTDSFVFGSKQRDAASVQLFTLKPRFDFGFRVGAGYMSCNKIWGLRGSYLHIRNVDAAKELGLNFPGLSFGPFDIRAKRTFSLDIADARGVYCLIDQCRYQMDVWLGGEYLRLREKQILKGLIGDEEAFVERGMGFEGGGVAIGLRGQAVFCDCIGFSGEFGGLMTIGSRKLTVDATGLSSLFKAHIPSEVSCVPGVFGKVGLTMTKGMGCLCVTGQLSYEIRNYFGVLKVYDLQERKTSVKDVGYQGPSASITIKF